MLRINYFFFLPFCSACTMANRKNNNTQSRRVVKYFPSNHSADLPLHIFSCLFTNSPHCIAATVAASLSSSFPMLEYSKALEDYIKSHSIHA